MQTADQTDRETGAQTAPQTGGETGATGLPVSRQTAQTADRQTGTGKTHPAVGGGPVSGLSPSADRETTDRETETGGGRAATWVLATVVITGALGISSGAGFISYQTIRDLAVYFNFDRSYAWLVMPLIEVFMVIGTAEGGLRALRKESAVGPLTAVYGALIATLACNVSDHVLRLQQRGGDTFHSVILGMFAALIPVAQIIALHFLVGRLRRIADGRRARRGAVRPDGPSLFGQIGRALGERALAKVAIPEQPVPASPVGAVGAGGMPVASDRQQAPRRPVNAPTSPGLPPLAEPVGRTARIDRQPAAIRRTATVVTADGKRRPRTKDEWTTADMAAFTEKYAKDIAAMKARFARGEEAWDAPGRTPFGPKAVEEIGVTNKQARMEIAGTMEYLANRFTPPDPTA